jgi:4-hydroxy-2-oxoheptanedioate aldolase
MPTPAAPIHGLWRIIPSPALSELLAQSGLDFQILDCEHGAYDYATLLPDLLACERHGCAPLVRVSGTDQTEVQRCLDLGARGLVFPQLANLADFAAAAAMMDYAPAGTRGFNPFVRAGAYGSTSAVGRPWFVPIIETLAAVAQLDAILELERIDLVYVGSYDLSAQLGVAGKMDAPALTQVVDRILAASRRAGKPVGMMVLSEEAARLQAERGVAALVHGVESHRLKQAVSGMVRPLRELRLPPGSAAPDFFEHLP